MEHRMVYKGQDVRWTDDDEKQFQFLLMRRRKMVEAIVETSEEASREGFIDVWSYSMVEDFDEANAWRQVLDWWSPDEVTDGIEQLTEGA